MEKVLRAGLVSMSIICASANAAPAMDERAIGLFRRLEQFYREVGAGDLDSAMSLYAPDAAIILPNQPRITGAASIRTWWESTLKDREFKVSPELVEASDLGSTVVLEGRAAGKLVSRSGGPPIEINIWFVQIYRVQPDGRFLFWRGASGPNPSPTQQ